MTKDLLEQLAELLPDGTDLSGGSGNDLAQAFARVGEALQPVEPSTSVKQRLMASVAAPRARWAPFTDRLAAMFDVATTTAADYLARIADPSAWEAAIGEGIALVHLQGGPATAGADVGFARVAAGTDFPIHWHDDREQTLVLQGGYEDSDGSIVRAGDQVEHPAGTSHSFRALPEADLIYAVVVWGVHFEEGIEAP